MADVPHCHFVGVGKSVGRQAALDDLPMHFNDLFNWRKNILEQRRKLEFCSREFRFVLNACEKFRGGQLAGFILRE